MSEIHALYNLLDEVSIKKNELLYSRPERKAPEEFHRCLDYLTTNQGELNEPSQLVDQCIRNAEPSVQELVRVLWEEEHQRWSHARHILRQNAERPLSPDLPPPRPLQLSKPAQPASKNRQQRVSSQSRRGQPSSSKLTRPQATPNFSLTSRSSAGCTNAPDLATERRARQRAARYQHQQRRPPDTTASRSATRSKCASLQPPCGEPRHGAGCGVFAASAAVSLSRPRQLTDAERRPWSQIDKSEVLCSGPEPDLHDEQLHSTPIAHETFGKVISQSERDNVQNAKIPQAGARQRPPPVEVKDQAQALESTHSPLKHLHHGLDASTGDSSPERQAEELAISYAAIGRDSRLSTENNLRTTAFRLVKADKSNGFHQLGQRSLSVVNSEGVGLSITDIAAQSKEEIGGTLAETTSRPDHTGNVQSNLAHENVQVHEPAERQPIYEGTGHQISALKVISHESTSVFRHVRTTSQSSDETEQHVQVSIGQHPANADGVFRPKVNLSEAAVDVMLPVTKLRQNTNTFDRSRTPRLQQSGSGVQANNANVWQSDDPPFHPRTSSSAQDIRFTSGVGLSRPVPSLGRNPHQRRITPHQRPPSAQRGGGTKTVCRTASSPVVWQSAPAASRAQRPRRPGSGRPRADVKWVSMDTAVFSAAGAHSATSQHLKEKLRISTYKLIQEVVAATMAREDTQSAPGHATGTDSTASDTVQPTLRSPSAVAADALTSAVRSAVSRHQVATVSFTSSTPGGSSVGAEPQSAVGGDGERLTGGSNQRTVNSSARSDDNVDSKELRVTSAENVPEQRVAPLGGSASSADTVDTEQQVSDATLDDEDISLPNEASGLGAVPPAAPYQASSAAPRIRAPSELQPAETEVTNISASRAVPAEIIVSAYGEAETKGKVEGQAPLDGLKGIAEAESVKTNASEVCDLDSGSTDGEGNYEPSSSTSTFSQIDSAPLNPSRESNHDSTVEAIVSQASEAMSETQDVQPKHRVVSTASEESIQQPADIHQPPALDASETIAQHQLMKITQWAAASVLPTIGGEANNTSAELAHYFGAVTRIRAGPAPDMEPRCRSADKHSRSESSVVSNNTKVNKDAADLPRDRGIPPRSMSDSQSPHTTNSSDHQRTESRQKFTQSVETRSGGSQTSDSHFGGPQPMEMCSGGTQTSPRSLLTAASQTTPQQLYPAEEPRPTMRSKAVKSSGVETESSSPTFSDVSSKLSFAPTPPRGATAVRSGVTLQLADESPQSHSGSSGLKSAEDLSEGEVRAPWIRWFAPSESGTSAAGGSASQPTVMDSLAASLAPLDPAGCVPPVRLPVWTRRPSEQSRPEMDASLSEGELLAGDASLPPVHASSTTLCPSQSTLRQSVSDFQSQTSSVVKSSRRLESNESLNTYSSVFQTSYSRVSQDRASRASELQSSRTHASSASSRMHSACSDRAVNPQSRAGSSPVSYAKSAVSHARSAISRADSTIQRVNSAVSDAISASIGRSVLPAGLQVRGTRSDSSLAVGGVARDGFSGRDAVRVVSSPRLHSVGERTGLVEKEMPHRTDSRSEGERSEGLSIGERHSRGYFAQDDYSLGEKSIGEKSMASESEGAVSMRERSIGERTSTPRSWGERRPVSAHAVSQKPRHQADHEVGNSGVLRRSVSRAAYAGASAETAASRLSSLPDDNSTEYPDSRRHTGQTVAIPERSLSDGELVEETEPAPGTVVVRHVKIRDVPGASVAAAARSRSAETAQRWSDGEAIDGEGDRSM